MKNCPRADTVLSSIFFLSFVNRSTESAVSQFLMLSRELDLIIAVPLWLLLQGARVHVSAVCMPTTSFGRIVKLSYRAKGLLTGFKTAPQCSGHFRET